MDNHINNSDNIDVANCFAVLILTLFCICFADTSFAADMNDKPPRLALYNIQPAVNDSKGTELASALTELLKMKLAESSKIRLLDRGLLLNVFDEKTMRLAQGSPDGLALKKLPVSDYIVTGILLSFEKNKYITLKVIDSKSSRIIDFMRNAVRLDKIDETIDMLNQFIHNSVIYKNKAKKMFAREISIGNFVNVSLLDTGIGRGEQIEEFLIQKFVSQGNVKVLSRTQTYPVLLEAYLRRLKFDDDLLVVARSGIPVYVQGKYKVDGTSPDIKISLYVDFNIITENLMYSRSVSQKITATTWDELIQRLDKVINESIITTAEIVGEPQIKQSSLLYDEAIKVSGFRVGESRINGNPWMFPDLIKPIRKDQDIATTIIKLNEVLRINPNHDKARVVLAFCLLQTDKSKTATAKMLLRRVFLNSKVAYLLNKADRVMGRKVLTADSFDHITDHPQELFDALVSSHYIDIEGDDLHGERVIFEAGKLDLRGYTQQQLRMISHILAPNWTYVGGWERLNGKRYRGEAKFYFYEGLRYSQIGYSGKENYLPKIDLERLGGEGSQQRKVSRMRVALDAFSMALFEDGKFYAAMYHLAQLLRVDEIGYHGHAEMWFGYIIYNSPDDNWKFLSADAINTFEQVKFSDDFNYLFMVYRYAGNKSAAVINSVLGGRPYSDEKLQSQQVLEAYVKNVYAICSYISWAKKNKRTHLRQFNSFRMLAPFNELTRLSKSSQIARRLRDAVLSRTSGKCQNNFPLFNIDNVLAEKIGNMDKVTAQKKTKCDVRISTESETIENGRRVVLDNVLSYKNRKKTNWGSSVGVYNNIMVVGEENAKNAKWYGAESGALNIYSRGQRNWKHLETLWGEKPNSRRSRKDIDWFGHSLDMYDDYIIVGAPMDDDLGSLLLEDFSGSGLSEKYHLDVLIEKLYKKGYLRGSLQITSKFKGRDDPNFKKDFTELNKYDLKALAKVLNKSKNIKNSGSVHIFHRNGDTWVKEKKLNASDASKGVRFGVDVAIYNNYALVCAHGAYDNQYTITGPAGTHGGGAYIFHKKDGQWDEGIKLTSEKCHAVSLWRNWAMVGVRDSRTSRGTVYAYQRVDDKWEKHQELKADDFSDRRDTFRTYGQTIDMSDGYIVIGNKLDDFGDRSQGLYGGSVYVFKLYDKDWVQQQKLYAPEKIGRNVDYGSVVSISGDYLLVGVPGLRNASKDNVGKVFLYKRNKECWNMFEEILAKDGQAQDLFGLALSIQNNSVIISARGYDRNGKIYIYEIKK